MRVRPPAQRPRVERDGRLGELDGRLHELPRGVHEDHDDDVVLWEVLVFHCGQWQFDRDGTSERLVDARGNVDVVRGCEQVVDIVRIFPRQVHQISAIQGHNLKRRRRQYASLPRFIGRLCVA